MSNPDVSPQDALDAASGADRGDDKKVKGILSEVFGDAAPAPKVEQETDERIGQILSGWRLDARLGVGRTASVYAGSNQEGQRCAIKIMHARFRGDGAVRRRIFREASFARRVEHANVTRVLANDVTSSGDPYIVMERLLGRDLGRIVRARGAGIEEEAALLVMVEVANALIFAHGKRIHHRNLAPFNIFLTVDGDVKLFDFGSAYYADEVSHQHLEAFRTDLHGFIAPELLGPRAILDDARSDVYSFGLVTLHLLSGRPVGDPPGYEFDYDELLRTAEESEGPTIAYVRRPLDVPGMLPHVSPRLAAYIGRMIDRDPELRPTTMVEVLEELLAVLGTFDPDLATESDARRLRLETSFRALYSSREDLEREDTGAWRSATILRDLFRLVENVLQSARRFGWDHGETEIRVEHLVAQVLASVAGDPDGIFWFVRPYSFEFQGAAIWSPETPFDETTYNLFDAGFRKMQLLPGLTDEECRQFLRWMVLDPKTDLPVEDDLATVFWSQEFRFIKCELVSAVVLQDVEDYERLDAELKEMRADAIDHLRTSISKRLTGTHLTVDQEEQARQEAASQMLSLVRGSNLPYSDRFIRDAGASLESPLALWRGKVAELIFAADNDAARFDQRAWITKPFSKFVSAAINERDTFDAIAVYGELSQHFMDERRRDYALPFIESDHLFKLLTEFIPFNETKIYGDDINFVAQRLDAILRMVPADQSPLVIEAVARCKDRTLLAVLLRFVARHAIGFERPLGELLRSANPLLGSNIIHILRQHPSRDTAMALEFAAESPHARIRIEAAEVLAKYAPSRGLRELRKLLRHEDPRIRKRALDAISVNRIEAAAELLLARVDERDFKDLPVEERSSVLRAACALSDEEGEKKLTEMVSSHGFLPNEEIDQAREIAVEILADVALTDAALDAVRQASKSRLWNSKSLQEKAHQAVSQIEQRIRDLDQELGGRSRKGPEGR